MKVTCEWKSRKKSFKKALMCKIKIIMLIQPSSLHRILPGLVIDVAQLLPQTFPPTQLIIETVTFDWLFDFGQKLPTSHCDQTCEMHLKVPPQLKPSGCGTDFLVWDTKTIFTCRPTKAFRSELSYLIVLVIVLCCCCFSFLSERSRVPGLKLPLWISCGEL